MKKNFLLLLIALLVAMSASAEVTVCEVSPDEKGHFNSPFIKSGTITWDAASRQWRWIRLLLVTLAVLWYVALCLQPSFLFGQQPWLGQTGTQFWLKHPTCACSAALVQQRLFKASVGWPTYTKMIKLWTGTTASWTPMRVRERNVKFSWTLPSVSIEDEVNKTTEKKA